MSRFQHLWPASLKPVACEMCIFWLPLLTREQRRHSSKSWDWEGTTAVGTRMLVLFLLPGSLFVSWHGWRLAHHVWSVFCPGCTETIRTTPRSRNLFVHAVCSVTRQQVPPWAFVCESSCSVCVFLALITYLPYVRRLLGEEEPELFSVPFFLQDRAILWGCLSVFSAVLCWCWA